MINPNNAFDFILNGGNSFTLSEYDYSTQNSSNLVSFSSSISRFYSNIRINDVAELGETTAPDNTTGYSLSLGMRNVSGGGYLGKGVSLVTNSLGNFYLLMNTTTNGIGSYSQAGDHIRLEGDETNSQFTIGFRNTRFKIPASITGASRYLDLSFMDDNISGTDKRYFVIRALSSSTNAPNTLEFWDPQGNGNAYFALPVRIGGNYADVSMVSNSQYQLFVSGGIRTELVKVDSYSNWPDYVFKSEYNHLSLDELESYINTNGHLPGVPDAETVEKDGIELTEMNAVLLEKVEELTLYVLELQKQIDELKSNN